MFMHSKLRCRDSRLDDAIDRDVPSFDGKAAERAFELLERHTGIEQGAQNHVARRASETVEVQNPQSSPSALKLKYDPPLPRMM